MAAATEEAAVAMGPSGSVGGSIVFSVSPEGVSSYRRCPVATAGSSVASANSVFSDFDFDFVFLCVSVPLW